MNPCDHLADTRAHARLEARVFNDTTIPPGTRELILTLSWVTLADPSRHFRRGASGKSTWARVKDVLARQFDQDPAQRLRRLIADDAPRYKRSHWGAETAVCEGRRVRPRRINAAPVVDIRDPHNTVPQPPVLDEWACGQRGSIGITERDMASGWVTVHHFCRKHEAEANELHRQLRERGKPPEPIPNTGGHLPRFFTCDWERIYSWADPCWTKPLYGMSRNEWPSPDGATPGLWEKPVLTVVPGDLTAIGGGPS